MGFKNDDQFPHHLAIDANGSDVGSQSTIGSVSQVKQWVRRSCTTRLLKRRLPFLQWAPTYTFRSIFHDAIAGFTVALTAIPQGIAYGAVAGLPVEVTRHSFHLFGGDCLSLCSAPHFHSTDCTPRLPVRLSTLCSVPWGKLRSVRQLWWPSWRTNTQLKVEHLTPSFCLS